MAMNDIQTNEALEVVTDFRKQIRKGFSPHYVLITACRFAEGWEIQTALPYVLGIEEMFNTGHLTELEDVISKVQTLLDICEKELKIRQREIEEAKAFKPA